MCLSSHLRSLFHRITTKLLPAFLPQVQEAMLTGESVPISKNLRAVAEASGLGDRKCMAFSATTVSAGQGLGVVTATGDCSYSNCKKAVLRFLDVCVCLHWDQRLLQGAGESSAVLLLRKHKPCVCLLWVGVLVSVCRGKHCCAGRQLFTATACPKSAPRSACRASCDVHLASTLLTRNALTASMDASRALRRHSY